MPYNENSHQINIESQNKNLNNNISNNNIDLNKEPELIWIDYGIERFENQKYLIQLKNIITIEVYKSMEEGINRIKEIKFKRIMVMLNKKIFEEFINLFQREKNHIFCSINILIFTYDKKSIYKICENNKEISSGFLFKKINTFGNITEVINFIKNEIKGQNKILNCFEKIDNNNRMFYDIYYDNFQKIENYEDLILPIYYQRLIEPISLEEIHNFNYYLMNSFGEEMKKKISQFENIAEMPVEIICKYWANAYTLEKGQFYSVLNVGLKKNNFKLFLPFIKMMYEGLRRKVFHPFTKECLYSGGLISNIELQNLRNNLNINNNDNLPKVIYYFKSFKSFSKNKEKAKRFIKKTEKDSIGLLFILEKCDEELEEEFISNIEIKEFSKFPNEDEVLFFPFSSFEVNKIEDSDEGYVIIFLKYLGKYKSYIEENKPNEDIFDDNPISQFGRDITELGLIDYKFKKFWEIKKEINLDSRDAICLLYFEDNKLLISIENMLELYNIVENKIIQIINVYENRVIDLLKLNDSFFIASSKDKKIRIIKLINNFTDCILIRCLELHSDAVNQTIKLNENNLYASCSNDTTIKIWNCDISINVIDNYSLIKVLNNLECVLSIYELPDSEIISLSLDGNLKFWQNYICSKTIKGFKNPLHNCIFLLKDNIISIGLKKQIILVDLNKKEKIKKFVLDYNAFSICYLNGNILLGMKGRRNKCYLMEYKIVKKLIEVNVEFIGKGKDFCSEISCIQAIDSDTVITANKLSYIKIWKKTEKKPIILQNDGSDPESDLDEGDMDYYIKNKDSMMDNNINNYYPYHFDNMIFPPNLNDNSFQMKNFNYLSKIKNFNNSINNNSYEYENSFNLNDNSKLNIIFQISSGISFQFLVDKNMTVCELLKLFVKNVNLEEDVIDKEISFIFNAQKIGLNNSEKIEKFFYNNSKIIVLDSNNIIGKKFITFYINEQKYNIPINEKENMYTLVKKYIEVMGIKEQEGKIDFLKEIQLTDFFMKLSNNSLNEK